MFLQKEDFLCFQMFLNYYWTASFFLNFSGSSWFASVFLVVNAALGAGLLNFPQAYQQAGGVLTAIVIQAVRIQNYF